MKKITPAQELISVTETMLKKIREHDITISMSRKQSLKKKLVTVEGKIEWLLERVVETDNPEVVLAYEQKIKKLQSERCVLEEKIEECSKPLVSFEEILRTPLEFLANPLVLWAKSGIADKKMLLKMTFLDKLVYQRGKGFRTPKTTLPFSGLGDFCSSISNMAHPERFELPTKWFEATYSIQLSYGCVLIVLLSQRACIIATLALHHQLENTPFCGIFSQFCFKQYVQYVNYFFMHCDLF